MLSHGVKSPAKHTMLCGTVQANCISVAIQVSLETYKVVAAYLGEVLSMLTKVMWTCLAVHSRLSSDSMEWKNSLVCDVALLAGNEFMLKHSVMSHSKGFQFHVYRNKAKLVNYRLVKDNRKGCYYIHANNAFPSIQSLLSHYKTTPINSEVNTCLLNPVLSEEQQQMAKSTSADDTYVIMERGRQAV